MRNIRRKNPSEIIPNVYRLNAGATNIILIIEEEVTIIDAGLPGSSSRILKSMSRLGRSLEEIGLIIITHGHFDHVGGLAELRKLTRAKVAAHQADMSETAENAPYPGVIRRLLQRLLKLRSFSILHSVFWLRPDEVDIQLAGGEILDSLGGLEIIHTPGHTPGSISIFSPHNKLLIAGDALNKRRGKLRLPPKLVSSDLDQALESIKKMAQLDCGILCLGHGRPLTGDVRARMQDLIDRIRD